MQLKRTVIYHLKTLFLFTKSDFKTVVFPQAVFSLAFISSQVSQTTLRQQVALRIPHLLVWTWLHLLVVDISNQRLPGSILEDGHNKPWRPIPSGRLTPCEAESLVRWGVVVALATSVALQASEASTALMAFLWLYNDLGGNGVGPLQRNALNAAGLGCFGWGGVSVLYGGGDGMLEAGEQVVHLRLGMWLALCSLVIITTIHAQDFPDVAGDRARGRGTMPLLYGETGSRWALAVAVVIWSIICPMFWQVTSPFVWSASVSIGFVMASLTIVRRDIDSDKTVWKLWCLWISILYLLPLFGDIYDGVLMKQSTWLAR